MLENLSNTIQKFNLIVIGYYMEWLNWIELNRILYGTILNGMNDDIFQKSWILGKSKKISKNHVSGRTHSLILTQLS